ncbi:MULTISPECIES: hypothetical protein [unclassified Escherichia]|nr:MULTISPECIES: hypothetical protein [unclassified Escherichia]
MAQSSTLLRNDSDLPHPLYRIWRRGRTSLLAQSYIIINNDGK